MVKTKGWDMPWSRYRWEGRIRIRDLKVACEVYIQPYCSHLQINRETGNPVGIPAVGSIFITDGDSIHNRNCRFVHANFYGEIEHLPAILEDLRGLGGSILNIDAFVAIMDRYGYKERWFGHYQRPLPGTIVIEEGSGSCNNRLHGWDWERELGVKFDYTKDEWVLCDEPRRILSLDSNTGEISWI